MKRITNHPDTERLDWMLGGEGTLSELENGVWVAYSGPLDEHFERKSGRGAIDAAIAASKRGRGNLRA